MGTFSIWHLVIVLSYFVLPITAIARTAGDDRRGRGKVWKVLGVVVLLVVIQNIAQAALPPEQLLPLLLLGILAGLFFSYWAARTLAARCQDLNWSRWVALLQLIPVVNLVFFIVVGIMRSRAPAPAERDAAMAEA